MKKKSKLKQLFCDHSFKCWGIEKRTVNKIFSEHHDLECEKCGKFITIRKLSREREGVLGMTGNKVDMNILTVEQAQLFNNKETQYILRQQRMPAGTTVWHPNETYKNEDDD